MNKLDDLVLEIKNEEVYKGYKKYLEIAKENKEYTLVIDKLHEVSKNIVNAKHLGLVNQYELSKKEYDEIQKNVENNVFFALFQESEENFKKYLQDLFDDIGLSLQKYIENIWKNA